MAGQVGSGDKQAVLGQGRDNLGAESAGAQALAIISAIETVHFAHGICPRSNLPLEASLLMTVLTPSEIRLGEDSDPPDAVNVPLL